MNCIKIINFLQGCSPTVLRAMVVNAAQLGTYSQAKQFLLSTRIYSYNNNYYDYNTQPGQLLHYYILFADYFKDDIKCHFSSSMISGFVTTVVSMPVDIAKTR